MMVERMGWYRKTSPRNSDELKMRLFLVRCGNLKTNKVTFNFWALYQKWQKLWYDVLFWKMDVGRFDPYSRLRITLSWKVSTFFKIKILIYIKYLSTLPMSSSCVKAAIFGRYLVEVSSRSKIYYTFCIKYQVTNWMNALGWLINIRTADCKFPIGISVDFNALTCVFKNYYINLLLQNS